MCQTYIKRLGKDGLVSMEKFMNRFDYSKQKTNMIEY